MGFAIRSHASKLAVILVVIAFLCAIVILATPWWYTVSYTFLDSRFTFSVGLFKVRACGFDECSSETVDSFNDDNLDSATNVAIVGLVFALALSCIFFITSALQMTGKAFGPIDQKKLSLVNFVLSLIITIAYIMVMLLYPIIFGGANESGEFLDWKEGYFLSYYALIPVILLSMIATIILGMDTAGKMRSGYQPV